MVCCGISGSDVSVNMSSRVGSECGSKGIGLCGWGMGTYVWRAVEVSSVRSGSLFGPYHWSVRVGFLAESILADLDSLPTPDLSQRLCLYAWRFHPVGITLRHVSVRCVCQIRSYKKCDSEFRHKFFDMHVPNTEKCSNPWRGFEQHFRL